MKIARAIGAASMAVAGLVQQQSALFGAHNAGFIVLGCACVSGGILAFELAMGWVTKPQA